MRTALWLAASVALVVLSSCGNTRCSASTCSGCCDTNGECQPGSSPTACGQSGFTCQQCSLASACINGMCSAFTGGGGSGTTGGGSGTTGGGSGTTGGGSGATGGGSGTTGPMLRAFNLNIEGTTLPGSCWRGGVAPPNVTFPAQTVEVLVFGKDESEQYLALENLSNQQLGDAPRISPPEAARGANGAFTARFIIQEPYALDYTELRQRELRFSFADLNAATTTGTLQLSATYACVNGAASCPTGPSAPTDSESCSATLNFTAQSIPVAAAWTTPTAATLNGAAKYLVTIDEHPVRNITTSTCYWNNHVPVGMPTVDMEGWRRLEIWQANSTHLRVPQQSWRLGDSPLIQLSADLQLAAGAYVHRQSVTANGAGYTETRDTSADIDVITGELAHVTFSLASTYSCTQSSGMCPTDFPPSDAASCSATLDTVTAQRLP